MPSRRSVTTYWCSTAVTATSLTPASRAVSVPHIPVAFTTVSHSTGPRSVSTVVTRLPSLVNPVTRQSWTIVTPAARAPAAKDWVSWLGSAYPSDGTQTAPCSPSEFSGGNNRSASRAESRCTSSPKLVPSAAIRRSSAHRAALAATRSEPTPRQPVAYPVLASSPEYVRTLVRISWVSPAFVRNWPTSPAACQVLPCVSRLRSTTVTSV